MNSTVLVIEDTQELREYLTNILADQGYKVLSAAEGTAALKLFEKISPDLVMLTAKHTVADISATLDLGADDYMAKPFEIDELLARVKARLRTNSSVDKIMRSQDLTLDAEKVEVTRDGKQIQLTPLEFKLLEYLLANKGRVLTRDMILARVWSTSPDIETRVVDVYMGYLRKKIDKAFSSPILHSVRGFGYMVKE